MLNSNQQPTEFRQPCFYKCHVGSDFNQVMRKIVITKEEIKFCKEQARAATTGLSCYDYYRQRNEIYNSILKKKTGMSNIRFDLHGGDLIYGERIANANPSIVENVISENGFTSEEYSKLTGEPVPNQWYEILVAEDKETRKVYRFEQNGNVSVMNGASIFSKEYKHLIKSVWSKCQSVSVEIV
jgi:hypothetical protein